MAFKVKRLGDRRISIGDFNSMRGGLTHVVVDTGLDGMQAEPVGFYEGKTQAEVGRNVLGLADMRSGRVLLGLSALAC